MQSPNINENRNGNVMIVNGAKSIKIAYRFYVNMQFICLES